MARRNEAALTAALDALAAYEAAGLAREVAIADALKSGWSVREMQRLTGLSMSTIQKWGHRHGWPTAAQRRAWQPESLEDVLARLPKRDDQQ